MPVSMDQLLRHMLSGSLAGGGYQQEDDMRDSWWEVLFIFDNKMRIKHISRACKMTVDH